MISFVYIVFTILNKNIYKNLALPPNPCVTAYFCDFDLNDNCGGVLNASNSGINTAFTASVQFEFMDSIVITDFTSICKHLDLNAFFNLDPIGYTVSIRMYIYLFVFFS